MNEQVLNKVLTDYVIENANLKITIERLKEEINKLKTEVSECSKNSEPNE